MNTKTQADAAHLPPMSDETRGEAIKRRRLALGISNPRQFAQATGRDRDTITRAEAGAASETTMDWLEAWLGRREAAGVPGAPTEENGGGPIRLTLHGVYGIEEIIVEGPVDHPEELAEAVGKILDRLKARDEE